LREKQSPGLRATYSKLLDSQREVPCGRADFLHRN
jgi:hypothetical protein